MSDEKLSRRAFVGVSAAVAAGAITKVDRHREPPIQASSALKPSMRVPSGALDDLTISDLQQGLTSGKYTARSLVEQYQARIASLDKQGPTLNGVLELNPDALMIADQLDAERKSGKTRGSLHGIPILIKDNIDTADRMHTSAGSLALESSIPLRDSWLADRLRAAGAVILGKTNLSEWANIRSSHSSSGWSGRGEQCKNPYALDRSPSGSSSGSGAAVAASYCAAAIGSETDGSITSPSAASGLVGIKPTVGLVGRSGLIPISHSQDTAGPMARCVRDAALVLGALTGIDPRDDATKPSAGKSYTDYTRFLDVNGLKGARIGIAREAYMGYSPKTDKMVEQAIDVLKQSGATIVDPANIATANKFGDAEFEVLLYELKADLNAYLDSLGPSAPYKTLADLIRFNEENASREMPYFGQEVFEQAQRKGPLTEAKYKKARAKCVQMSRTDGIDLVMTKHRLDALVAPTQGPVWAIDLVNGDCGGGGSFTQPAAVAGYPHITVPMGLVQGLPVGLSFVGRAWNEPTLLKLAYAYEQASKARRPPTFQATIALT